MDGRTDVRTKGYAKTYCPSGHDYWQYGDKKNMSHTLFCQTPESSQNYFLWQLAFIFVSLTLLDTTHNTTLSVGDGTHSIQ